MRLTETIAQHIMAVHNGNNWTDVNLENTLQNVSFQDAVRVTKASPNSIAALLHHISFYNEVVLNRIQGVETTINQANGFDYAPINSLQDWEDLKKRSLQSSVKLAEVVRSIPEEKLFEPVLSGYSTYYKTLQGLVEHTHYHLGQIVIIKHLIRNLED